MHTSVRHNIFLQARTGNNTVGKHVRTLGHSVNLPKLVRVYRYAHVNHHRFFQTDKMDPADDQKLSQTQELCTQNTQIDDTLSPSPTPEAREPIFGTLKPLISGWNEIHLKTERTTLGRHPSCDINVDLSTMSNLHCVFAVVKEDTVLGSKTVIYLEDHSTNGTYVNNVRLGKGNRRALLARDVVGFPVQAGKKKPRANSVYELDLSSERDETSEPVFGDLLITRDQLGKGSFAEVRLARNLCTGKLYAAKCIDKKRFQMKANLKMEMMKEAEILREVNHPCIIGIVDFHETPTMLYIILDLAQRGALFEFVTDRKALSEHMARNFSYQMLLAMKYLHDRHITHRDLKPENVLLDEYGAGSDRYVVKLTDFGLARIVGEASFMVTLCGTLNYVAPEVLNSQPYTNAVDCWSLGVIVYICLVGYPPFSEEYKDDIRDQIRNGTASYPQKYWKHISPEAVDFVKCLLQVDPQKRYTAEQALAHPWIQGDQAMIAQVDAMIEDLQRQKQDESLAASMRSQAAVSSTGMPQKRPPSPANGPATKMSRQDSEGDLEKTTDNNMEDDD